MRISASFATGITAWILYSNALIASRALINDHPEAVRGLVRAVNRGLIDTLADPDAGIAAVAQREPLIDREVEKMRLMATLRDEMSHPEIERIGIGDISPQRFAEAIDIVVAANDLPRTAGCRGSLLARLPAAGRRARAGSGLRRQIMDLGMKGRVALITGPVKGMGAAVSLAFAREGCQLALAGRDIAAIEPLARQIRDDGGEALVIACDMTDAAACETAVAVTTEAHGAVDILVNVAGGSGADRQDRG